MKNTNSRELNAQDPTKANGSQGQTKAWRSTMPSANSQTPISNQTSEMCFSQDHNRQGYENAKNSFPSGVGMKQAFDGSNGGAAFNFLGGASRNSGLFNFPGAEKTPTPTSLETAEERFAKKVKERFGKKTENNNNTSTAESLMSKVGWNFGGESMRPPNNLYATTDMSSDASLSTAHSFGASRTTDSVNMEYNPRSFLSEASFIKPPIPKHPVVEEKKPISVVEEEMKAIIDHQINCVSLLNEVGSKVKKKVDYTIKEVPNSKIKVFECQCLLNGKKVGSGRGNSKQAAKNDAAIDAVRTLLTNKEEYNFEETHITLAIQKSTGLGMGMAGTFEPEMTTPEVVKTKPVNQEEVFSKSFTSQTKSDISFVIEPQNASVDSSYRAPTVNDSALYELNLISKECFVEPRWQMSPPGGRKFELFYVMSNENFLASGDFEAQVIFDDLVAVGKGRKKLDAKREAAAKILQMIRENKDLSEKYNPKANKKTSNGGEEDDFSQLARNDPRRILFERSIDPKSLKEIKNGSEAWIEGITKSNKRFNDYLIQAKAQSILDEENSDFLFQIFKLLADYSEVITSNPKQILLDASRHLADYVSNFSLIPIGSFALDCMRRDKLSVDILANFKQTQKISEKEFLQLFLDALKECDKLAPKKTQGSNYKLDFSLRSSDFKDYIEVRVSHSPFGEVTFQIQMAENTETLQSLSCDPSIVHIKRIYDCFDNSESLDQFRTLMSFMRNWREKNRLFFLVPELMDAVLLTEFLSNKAGNFAGYITNTLITMSTEETFQASLSKCGPYYTKLYKNILSKMKWSISTKCSQSLEAIYEETFEKSNLA